MVHERLTEILTNEEITSAKIETINKYPNKNFYDIFNGLFEKYIEFNGRLDDEHKIVSALEEMLNLGYSKSCMKVYDTIYHALKDIQE